MLKTNRYHLMADWLDWCPVEEVAKYGGIPDWPFINVALAEILNRYEG